MKKALSLLVVCIVAVSCAPSTPQSRIEKHPEKFTGLSTRHKSLAEKGQIERGMPKDAVWIAWGAPAQRYEGSQDGKSSERWDYVGSYPVYSSGFYGGYGYWGGPYRRGYYPYYAYGVYPEVTYVPYRRASVMFTRDKVESWERAQ